MDGSGRSPIQFGQYTLGYRTGNKPSDGGSYIISESQQNLVPNAVWAMGGTWLTMFRWWKGWSLGLVDTGRDGRRTPQFDRYRAINHTMAALSPHLSRLRSTDIRLIRGQHRALGAAVTNPPSSIPAWSRGAGNDAAITDITVNNRGKTNDGLPGDVLVGFFRPLEGLPTQHLAFFPGPDTRYFMITNCLTAPNSQPADPNSTGGGGADTAQTIRVTFDLHDRDPRSLCLVDPFTGRSIPVALTRVRGTTYHLDQRFYGGTSALYFWSTPASPLPVNPGAPAADPT